VVKLEDANAHIKKKKMAPQVISQSCSGATSAAYPSSPEYVLEGLLEEEVKTTHVVDPEGIDAARGGSH